MRARARAKYELALTQFISVPVGGSQGARPTVKLKRRRNFVYKSVGWPPVTQLPLSEYFHGTPIVLYEY